MTFHDPTVGSGGMLTEAAQYYQREQDGDPSKLTFTGRGRSPRHRCHRADEPRAARPER